MEYKYQAIVLSKIDIAETDRIYTAYTREAGKIRMLAKGVRKPNAKLAGSLESLTHAEVFLARSKGCGKVTGVIGTDCFLALKEDIRALEKVFYAFKIFDRLIGEEERDEEIFILLLDYLVAMDNLAQEKIENSDEAGAKLDIITLGFVFKLFFLSGYGLEAKKCVECSGKLASGENYFSAKRGGVICHECAKNVRHKNKINDSAVKFIRIFIQNRIENFNKLKAEKKSLDNLKIILNETVRWMTDLS